MDPHMENSSEHEMAGETVNLHDEKQGHEDDLEVPVGEKRWPGWPGDSVFRILVPSHKIGGIIGRKGEFIKKMCEESKARIKIVDGPQGAPERAVIISAKEEQDALISPAMDGLLRVHKRIVDGLDGEANHAPQSVGNKVPTRLLVASTQAGTLIGKQGATIRSIQESSNAAVRILDDLPPVALQDDRIVEIQGEPAAMHKALELIAAHLRKFLVDHSVLPLFETPMSVPHQQSMPHQHMEQNMAPPQHWGPANAGPGYGGNPQFMPPRQHDNFYPPYEKPPHHGISTYGRDAPQMGGHLSSANQQPPQMVSQVTNHMQIPLAYADAVIGAAGASISYIRRSSGATITIQETRGVPGEMTVEIIGSATQVQTAQQLIQNFMAGAGAPSQPQQSQAQHPADHQGGYGSYPAAVYGSPGSAGPTGYGSGYGNNYGY